LSILKSILILSLFCLFQAQLHADEQRPRVLEVALAAGSDHLAGSLATDSKAHSGGILLNIWPHGSESRNPALGGVTGYFSIELMGLGKSTARTSDFPFTPNEGITIERSSLSPFICALSDYWARLCIGVGYGVESVSQFENSQEYGTFLWSLNLQHHFENHITAGLGTEWNQVRMIVNNNESSFETWNTFLTVGYLF
jgi:hypothetical protein